MPLSRSLALIVALVSFASPARADERAGSLAVGVEIQIRDFQGFARTAEPGACRS